MKKILFILMTCFIYTMTHVPLAQATNATSGDRALAQLTSRHGSFYMPSQMAPF